jgi:hypothetical protein
MSSEITLPVGGLTDKCGVCGRGISGEHERGLIGLNGVLCANCTQNIHLFTPLMAQFNTADGNFFRSYSFSCYPDTPYWDAAANVILINERDLNIRSPEAVTEFYQEVSSPVKEALWNIASVGEAKNLAKISPTEVEWGDLNRSMSSGIASDSDNPYTKLLARAPKPNVFDGSGFYADFSNTSADPTELEEAFGENSQTKSQGQLSDFESVDDSSGSSHNRRSASPVDENTANSNTSTSGSEPDGQTSLAVF